MMESVMVGVLLLAMTANLVALYFIWRARHACQESLRHLDNSIAAQQETNIRLDGIRERLAKSRRELTESSFMRETTPCQ